ncbi:MAG TPA: hypothetical protein VKT52_05965 [Ktedonobacterales bacterium]|nr:hypothetical protein [Ktedonobacterales bacterium]
MSSESQARIRAEEIDIATGKATSLIRARYLDPEAWVRLAFSVSAGIGGDSMVYHFDAFGPTMVEHPHVLVSRDNTDLWETVLTD